MEGGLGIRLGDAERDRGVGHAQLGEVGQCEDRPLVAAQGGEHSSAVVRLGRARISGSDVLADVDDDVQQPRVELVQVGQPADVPPGGDEGVPGGVPRSVLVEEDQAGSPVDAFEGVASQDREGVVVACLRPADRSRSMPLLSCRRYPVAVMGDEGSCTRNGSMST